MLPDYDAKAIADVMGLAFVRDENLGSKTALGAKAEKGASDFVIRVDGASVLMVEAKSRDTLAPFPGEYLKGALKDRVASLSHVFIEKAVEGGLPRQALRHVAELLAGGDVKKTAALELAVVPKTTLERRERKLSTQESERTERIARLFVHARRALGTDAEAREFMSSPHPELDGRTPIEVARTDLGTRRTERILTAIEYGLAM